MKKALAVAALALAALAVRRHLAMRDALAAVPVELRRPFLPFFPASYSARTLRLWRLPLRMSPGRGVAVTERQVGDPALRVLVTTPANGESPCPAVLWIHGGGMILGSPSIELPIADELGIDADRIAVAGASAGGGLSAAVTQRSHDEGIPLRAQALVYPMIDDRTVLRDDHGGRGRFVWTPGANRFGWTSYLGGEPDPSAAPEYAVPARRTDLTGLPPAWIGVGDLDLFHDEDVAYAEKLKACGVPCELVTVAGMYHGADGFAPKAPSMKEFRRGMFEHLRTYL